MESPNLPPIDAALNRADAHPAPSSAANTEAVEGAALEQVLEAAVAAPTDHVTIHPLDANGALQILMAELSAELPLRPAAGAVAAPTQPLPATAPQTLLQMFLQALPPPETQRPREWLADVMRSEDALQGALERAVQIVAGWREVPPAVVDDARQTRAIVVAAIMDEPPNPLLLRPEWLGLAPWIERYRRLRRRARRLLSDPDAHYPGRDEVPEKWYEN